LTDTAQPGGTANVLKSSEAPGLDPIQMANAVGTDGWPGEAIFDFLVYVEDGNVKGSTADSLTSTDGLVWTLKLRPNIKFSDGTAYDAAAVKFNILRLQDPANAAVRAIEASSIASMDILDPVTLKFTLKGKNGIFPKILALMPFIGSPKAIQEKGSAFSQSPVGAGPFMMKSWVRDSQMTLVRNPTYWNAPLPYLDQILFRTIPDDTERINTFCSGDGNFLYTPDNATVQPIVDQKCGLPNSLATNGGRMIFMNIKKAPFTDLRVRQAVQLGIDPNDFTKVVENGSVPGAKSIYAPTSPFFDSSAPQPAYDPTKAQQLFDQVAADNGGPVAFTLNTYNVPTYIKAATYLQGTLNKYKNVKVDIQVLAVTVQLGNIANGTFQASYFGQPFDDPDPVWLTRFSCDSKTTGFCDSQWDQALADSRASLDGNQRATIIKNAEKLLLRDIPVTVLENSYVWVFTAPNVNGFSYVTAGDVMWDRVWLKTH
jgi:peptide/nickel transport system substrate-binding protein